MAKREANIGAGDVVINLDGEDKVLKPSYQAARTISSMQGGISGAIQRVVQLDIETVTQVVTLGLGYGQGQKPPKDLAEKIWRTGLTDDSGGLAERCVLFLRVLASGGRMPRDQKEGGDGGDEDDRDPPK
jgi:hypothetical protein